MRPLADLVVRDDSAWPLVEELVRDAGIAIEIVPRDPARCEATLIALQITTRSTLGAIAYHAGAIRFDHGWVRLLGGGAAGIAGDLASWNGLGASPLRPMTPNLVIVSYDALGGVFALNVGALAAHNRNVWYLAPDTCAWEDLGRNYSDFVRFLCAGDLDGFYEGSRWRGWRDEVGAATFDQAIHVSPPLWTREGKNIAAASRKAVPATELFALHLETASQLAGLEDRVTIKLT